MTSLLEIAELREPAMLSDRGALEAVMDKVKAVVSQLSADHVMPPVVGPDPYKKLSLLDPELPGDLFPAGIAENCFWKRNPAARLVWHDAQEGKEFCSIHCGFVGRTLFHETAGDLCALQVVCDKAQRILIERVVSSTQNLDCIVDAVELAKENVSLHVSEVRKVLRALEYGGFLCKHNTE